MSLVKEIESLFDKLWPLNRSITGKDNRKTLEIMTKISNINILEIKSGTKCFDWVVPPEYHVYDAYFEDQDGNRYCDFSTNNLHLISYSIQIDEWMNYERLVKHLYFIEDQPDAIPYKTTYYKEDWGFCISKNEFIKLDRSKKYRVYINSEFNSEGSMTIGERIIPGESDQEILISTYICHPSLANNELSGPLLTIFLQREVEKIKNSKYTYRFLYLPETIGSIAYLSLKGEYLKNKVLCGLVVTCCGDSGEPTLKQTRKGSTYIDRVANYVLNKSFDSYKAYDFFPSGSDERQYSSQYFNLDVISIMRTMYAEYPEYHTSLDNKTIMSFEGMIKLLDAYLQIFNILNTNKYYLSNYTKCEPFLQNKGLYDGIGGPKSVPLNTSAILWLMNFSDGNNSIFDIAVKSKIDYFTLLDVSNILKAKHMLYEK